MFVRSALSIDQISCANPLGGKDELFCASSKWVTVTGYAIGAGGVTEATEEIQKIAAQWQAVAQSSKSINGKHSNRVSNRTFSQGWKGWPEQKLRDGDGREEQMLSYAGHLRSVGHPQIEIERLCIEANDEHYAEPLDEAVVLDRARRYKERSEQADAATVLTPNCSILGRVDHTDAGNVALLYNLSQGDIRYVFERKQFIAWNGNRWEIDKGNALTHQQMLKVAEFYKKKAEALCKQVREAQDTEQAKHLGKAAVIIAKWASACRNKNRLDAMLGLMQRAPRFLIEANQLDSNPWLVGVANGVVDLKTGVLRPDSKQEYVLKRCPVVFNPTARAPRWAQFIGEITSSPGALIQGKVTFIPRPHLAQHLQKALGYSLTGITDEHLMFGAVGRGANGKNVLLDTVKDVTGDYTETISPEVILASKQESNADQASPSIRKLAGARCAISSESNDGQRLDIAVVKRHTGGGSLTARGLHENPITFRISHKLWLMTNHIPRLDHMDDAIRARLHLIPFDMKWNRPGETNPDPTLPDADKGLMDTFKLEQEGILLWLIQGAVKYHAEGLMPPKEVVAFTQSYIASQDLLSRFLSECDPCPVEEGATAGILYARYEEYCRYEGERPQLGSTGSMGRRLKALGHIGKKYRDGVHYALRVKEI